MKQHAVYFMQLQIWLHLRTWELTNGLSEKFQWRFNVFHQAAVWKLKCRALKILESQDVRWHTLESNSLHNPRQHISGRDDHASQLLDYYNNTAKETKWLYKQTLQNSLTKVNMVSKQAHKTCKVGITKIGKTDIQAYNFITNEITTRCKTSSFQCLQGKKPSKLKNCACTFTIYHSHTLHRQKHKSQYDTRIIMEI